MPYETKARECVVRNVGGTTARIETDEAKEHRLLSTWAPVAEVAVAVREYEQPAIPEFLRGITVECMIDGTTDPGQQFVRHTLGERLITLDGDFTAADLREILKMMESCS